MPMSTDRIHPMTHSNHMENGQHQLMMNGDTITTAKQDAYQRAVPNLSKTRTAEDEKERQRLEAAKQGMTFRHYRKREKNRRKNAKRYASLLEITWEEYFKDYEGNTERVRAIRKEMKLQSMTGSNPLTNGISSESQKRKLDDDDETSPPSKRTRVETTANGVSKSSSVFTPIHLQHQWIFIVFVW